MPSPVPIHDPTDREMQFTFFHTGTDLASLKAFDAKRTERARRRLFRR